MAAKTRPDVDVLTEIGVIARLVTAGLERVLPLGLSAAAFDVLAHFAQGHAASSPLALAEATHVGKSAMTHTLQRLETQGLLALAEDPNDRRRKIVTLTPAGAEVQRAAMIAARPRLEALRVAFEPEDFEAALPFLRRLRAWLEERR